MTSTTRRVFPSTGALLDHLLQLPAAVLLSTSPDFGVPDPRSATAQGNLPPALLSWRGAAREAQKLPDDLGGLTLRRLLARPIPSQNLVEVVMVATRPSLTPPVNSLLAFADDLAGPPLLLWCRAFIPVRGPRLDVLSSQVTMIWDAPTSLHPSRRSPEALEAVQLLAAALERVFLASLTSQPAGVLDYVLEEPMRMGRLCERCVAPEDRTNPWAGVTEHAVVHISAKRSLDVLETCVDAGLANLIRVLNEAGLHTTESCEGDQVRSGYITFLRDGDAARCASWCVGKVPMTCDKATLRFHFSQLENLTDTLTKAILRV